MNISVVIPLYNKADHVLAAVTSALNQQLPPLEIIVVDDGSTDDGPALVATMNQPMVRLLRQANAGVSAARNAGIAQARGELIAFLDADDTQDPDYLAMLADMAASFPSAGLYATGYRRVDVDGHTANVGLAGWVPGATALVSDFYSAWSKGSFAWTGSIAVRRSLIEEYGLTFPIGEHLGEDQDMWFRVAEAAPMVYCNRALATYRTGVSGSATQLAGTVDQLLPCYDRLRLRLRARQVPERMVRSARRLLASHFINVARAKALRGDLTGASELMSNAEARANFMYWLRTQAWLLARRSGSKVAN